MLHDPEWPEADFIVGNPPFLGGKFLRRELGDEYVDNLLAYWRGRVPSECDLCCYWFEKARSQIERGLCGRAGLLATQGIRGGANRKVIERIKQTGGIFFAESDRPWVLEGANVHVSMVGFDDGSETERVLDGKPAPTINANLTATADITAATRLAENRGLSFMGDTKGSAFDIAEDVAAEMLSAPNPHGRPNSDVVTPWVNGKDITARDRGMWIVDFGVGMSEQDAAQYEKPFEYLRRNVKPTRDKNKRESYRKLWWQHVEARSGMRQALAPPEISRFIATPSVSKHRVFAWLQAPTLPDHQLLVFARSDDYFFGVLHSRIHEVWSRAQATQLREASSGTRYTPTTCFETFPLPWPPGEESQEDERVKEIAAAAAELNRLRENWLNPPEWTRHEILEFPASPDGPWAGYVNVAQAVYPAPAGPPPAGTNTGEDAHPVANDPHSRDCGTAVPHGHRARYPRVVARDEACAKRLKARTLTNLYNERPAWLDHAHRRLDEAVAAAYGWPADLSDEGILERLLELNRERSAGRKTQDG